MSKKPVDATDWDALRFEANELFTPSAPIAIADLFAGRQSHIGRLVDVVSERGRHAIIYGEPGVGKTSIAQVLRYVIPVRTSSIRYVRKAAFSSDDFSSLWLSVFRELSFIHEGKQHVVSELYQNGITPADVVRELSMFSENDIPIIVIDEYNLVSDSSTSKLMAETIKAVSDAGLKATIVIVGISDNVSDLVAGHESIGRCSEEILMPRMTNDEMRDVIEGRIRRLGMNIEADAKWKIINLSKGLPAFAHGLGKAAVSAAIANRRKTIREADVDAAIDDILNSSWNTLRTEYEVATHSNQEKARYKQILTACALAQSDEIGYFIPKQVQEPLSAILHRPIGIDGFNDNLKDFTEPKRGKVLQRRGQARIYRYRFRNPAMQPYVIMRGIQEGLIGEDARSALSAPEQPTLFPTEPLQPSEK